MVNNPEYGISLSPEAEIVLNKPSRAFNNNITDGLTKEQAEAVERYLEANIETVKNFILWMATQYEESLRKGLPREGDEMP